MGKNAINTKVNINSKNTKVTSDGVLIAQGTNDLPDTGYKFQVEGDIKMLNGTNKYLDLSSGRVGVRGDADHLLDGCDIKLYGDTCVTGDLMVSGTLTNGSGVSYATTSDLPDTSGLELTHLLSHARLTRAQYIRSNTSTTLFKPSHPRENRMLLIRIWSTS